jgi:drug/metabolite transporter (DMT)-like permease
MLAILLWSFSVAVTRRITEDIGGVTTAAVVYLLGGLLCALIQWARERRLPDPRRFGRRYLLVCGALFVACLASFYLAIGLCTGRLQSLEIALVNYLWTVLAVLLAVPLLGKRARPWLPLGLLLGVVGIALVITQGSAFSPSAMLDHVVANPAAYGLALVAAVSWALYSNLCRRWGAANREGAVALFMTGTGVALLVLRLFVSEPTGWTPRTVVEVVFLASTSTLGYVFWDIGVRRGDFVLLSASSYFTPLLSTLISCTYLRVLSGAKLWLGCALLIAGAVVSRLSVREVQPAADRDPSAPAAPSARDPALAQPQGTSPSAR